MIALLPLALAGTLAALPLQRVAAARAPGAAPLAERLDLVQASHGFGPLLPYRIPVPDAQGQPTQTVVEIRTHQDLIDNVTQLNPVLPVASWPVAPELPGGASGNHFAVLEFTLPIDVDSVLSSSPAGQSGSGLLGTITVLAVDPLTQAVFPVPGRAFIGGRTYGSPDPGNPAQLKLETWVSVLDGGGLAAQVVNSAQPGLGFPFTQGGAAGNQAAVAKLVQDNVFVFVPDQDGDLGTYETFPVGLDIQVRATTQVLSTSGTPLARQVLASATVGPDVTGPALSPVTVPADGDVDVDPQTTVLVRTLEPVQPLSIGTALAAPAGPGAAVTIGIGSSLAQTWKVPYTVLPLSVFDFTGWELTPGFAFPGQAPATGPLGCGSLSTVQLDYYEPALRDLAGNSGTFAGGAAAFEIGDGPGLVNAPVAPDAIYVARAGAAPALSVLDLNGFGQSTGDPSFDFSYSSFPQGWSNFPNNPNLIFYGPNLHPPLFPGTCPVNGGSAGVFTLTRDTRLSDQLLSAPLVTSVGDMTLGHSLDQLFNNGKDQGGCQAGGGNFCAITGKKVVELAFQPGGTVGPAQPGQTVVSTVAGGANPISFAPHPNPPPLVFPPLCAQPFIGGQEPTSSYTGAPATSGGLGLANLLVPGDPLGNPALGVPPSGLLARFQNTWFEGPDRASLPNPSACFDYQYRQQVGHLLYVVDRARGELLVLNSNRMQILERIGLPDPTELAMSPNLDLLAVTNQADDTVAFIDTDPASLSFHQIVQVTSVGRGPRGIAWDPGNEDILVTNEGDGTLSVLSAFTLAERKRIAGLGHPFDVVITQRQTGFGFSREVYFGWIINRAGELWIFESGPDGANGWGYDDVIGKAPFMLARPKQLAVDVPSLEGAVWVVHERPLDPNGRPTGEIGGALSLVSIDSTVVGLIPLIPGTRPAFRDMTLEVSVSIGESVLTGIPVDVAFDDQNNLGALPNVVSAFSAGQPLAVNGKSAVKLDGAGTIQPAKLPGYLLVAVPSSSEGPGVIDVLSIGSAYQRLDTDPYAPGTQSIPAPGVAGLMDYWSQ